MIFNQNLISKFTKFFRETVFFSFILGTDFFLFLKNLKLFKKVFLFIKTCPHGQNS